MPIRHEYYTFDDELAGFLPVLARTGVGEAPRYTVLDPNYTTGKQGAIRFIKIFRPGYFAGSIPGSMRSRLLPRTYAVGNSLVSSASINVVDAGIFIPGDQIAIIPPSARITINSTAGGWVVGDIASVTINGVAITYIVTAADIGGTLAITNAQVAAKVALTIKANPYTGMRADALAMPGVTTESVIVAWSRDFFSILSLTATQTSAAGTVVASAATMTPNQNVGTVALVDPVNNALSLTSNAAIAIPDKMPIGNPASSPMNLGLINPSQPIDLLFRESTNFALWVDVSVYALRMPYWDWQLASLFPEINLV